MIKTELIFHRDKERIKLIFGFNTEISNKIRTISEAAWSRTHKAWLVPNTPEAIKQLKIWFPDLRLPAVLAPVETRLEPKRTIVPKDENPFNDRNAIKIEVIGKKIILKNAQK